MRLEVTADENNITVEDARKNKRHVMKTSPAIYNRFAREYIYPGKSALDASDIETSSSIVIHQIDGPLMYE